VVSKNQGKRKASSGDDVETDKNHMTTASVLYDAVFIPGGKEAVEKMMKMGDVILFIKETFKYCKPIGAAGEATKLIDACQFPELLVFEQPAVDKGVVTSSNADKSAEIIKLFKKAMMQGRFWEREKNKDMISA
jgi:catalase